MHPRRSIRLSKVILLSLIFLFSCDSASDMGIVPLENGVWSNDEARFVIESQEAKIVFFCAEGTLPAPIFPDVDGHFELPGQMISGPLAGNETPVLFTGRVLVGEMELTISFADSSGIFGSYILEEGRDSGVQYICRC